VLSAAKVLAVARLLSKSIDQKADVPPISDTISRNLSSLRRRLLSKINAILVSSKSTFQELVDAICAFCIVTSSSSSDAIGHFQELRFVETGKLCSTPEKGVESLLAGFKYYLQSLQTGKQLLGGRLLDTLRDLRTEPILESSDVQSIQVMKADNLHHFVPSEILEFVPWIKQENTGDSESLAQLEEWSKIAFGVFLTELKVKIETLSDVSKVLHLRQSLLQIWLPCSVSTPTHSNPEIFHALRSCINSRMQDSIHKGANSLLTVAFEIERALQKNVEDISESPKSLWADEVVKARLGEGSASFKRELRGRLHGQSDTTATILTSVQIWATSVTRSMECIRLLRKERWIDYIEEGDDQDGDEEDERIEKLQAKLQNEDPTTYDQEHSNSLRDATSQFQSRIKDAGTQLGPAESVRKAIFLVRTIRGIHEVLTSSFPQQDLILISSALPHLHNLLATETTSTSFTTLDSSAFVLRPRNIRILRHLWEGSPSLPTQPSPRIFRLLQNLNSTMTQRGTDLWSVDAALALKRAVQEKLMSTNWAEIFGSPAESKTRKGKNSGDAVAGSRFECEWDDSTAIQIQNDFDVIYLSNALRVSVDGSDREPVDKHGSLPDIPDTHSTTWSSAVQRCKDTLSLTLSQSSAFDHDDDGVATYLSEMEARADAYWRRTSLLFGLIA
jgi:conserved oligomeric Golgi complex subunit 1